MRLNLFILSLVLLAFSCKKEKVEPADTDVDNQGTHLLSNHTGKYSGNVYMSHNWCYADTGAGPNMGNLNATQGSTVEVTLYGDSLINAVSTVGPDFNYNFLVGQGTSSYYQDSTACSNCVEIYSIKFITTQDSLYIFRSSETGTCDDEYDLIQWDYRLVKEY